MRERLQRISECPRRLGERFHRLRPDSNLGPVYGLPWQQRLHAVIRLGSYSWTLPQYNQFFLSYVAVPRPGPHSYLASRFFFIFRPCLLSHLTGITPHSGIPSSSRLSARPIPTLLIGCFSAGDFIGCCQSFPDKLEFSALISNSLEHSGTSWNRTFFQL